MKSRRMLTGAAAVLLAGTGGTLVFTYAKSADARALEGQAPVTVYVSTAQIPSGTLLREAAVKKLLVETKVAEKAVPEGALRSVDGNAGDLQAVSDIAPGEYVLAARFGTAPLGSKAIEVPVGMVAVSVQLTDPARVGKFVTPGTHIAIYDSYKLVKLGTDEKSKAFNELNIKGTHVLLEDVQVIGMGDDPLAGPAKTEESGKAGKAAAESPANFLVTVAVTPQQATRLVHGAATGSLYAALRGTGAKVEGTSSVSDLTLFAGLGDSQ